MLCHSLLLLAEDGVGTVTTTVVSPPFPTEDGVADVDVDVVVVNVYVDVIVAGAES